MNQIHKGKALSLRMARVSPMLVSPQQSPIFSPALLAVCVSPPCAPHIAECAVVPSPDSHEPRPFRLDRQGAPHDDDPVSWCVPALALSRAHKRGGGCVRGWVATVPASYPATVERIVRVASL